MSSPYPPLVHRPRHGDENPTILTIRRVESADANGSRSIFGENAGRLSFESAHTERSRFGKAVTNAQSVGFANAESGANAEKSGFGKTESSAFRETTEKSRLGEDENPQFGSRGDKTGLLKEEDVELQANGENLKLGFGTGGSGAGSGVGGKLRSSRRGNKRTPYDRPVTGRHATAGGSAAMAATSLSSTKRTVASRIRDSASRFIHSSASYVFSALFKRAPASIKANGEPNLAGVSSSEEGEICEEMLKAPAKKNDPTLVPASQVPPLVDAGGNLAEAEGSVLDIVQVEDILKQKTWSREQVNRLTRILQTRVLENNAINPTEEAEKMEEQPKSETKDASPVQVARAYMGEQATRPGIAATVRKSTFLSTAVQPSPVRTLVEDRYLSSPFSRNWPRSSASVRMPKRSLASEDDLASMGPVRRVRQKTSMLTNASPYSYSRRMTGLSKPSETRTSSPPLQSSQTALKILETLEKLSPSPRGKFFEASAEKSASGLRVLEKLSPTLKGKFSNEVVGVAGTSTIEQTPETSKAREEMLVQNLGLVSSPESRESKLIGKVTFGGMNFNNAEAVKKSVVKAPSHNITPVLGKGFRMNAVFEESNSDEEAKLQAKQHVSSESRDRAAHLNLKEEATAIPDSLDVSSTAATPSESFLPEPVQASALSVLMCKSHSPQATPSVPDKPEPFVTAVSQERLATFPSFSFPPVAVETRSTLSCKAASSPAVVTAVSLPVEKVLRVPNSAGAKPASPSRPAEASETTAASTATVSSFSTSSGFAITALPSAASVGTAAPASLGNASVDAVNVFLSPISTTKTIVTHTELPEVENAVTMATESPIADKLSEVDTMATDSMTEEADTSNEASTASPIPAFLFNSNVQPSTASTFSFGGVSSTPSSATFPVGGGLGTASSSSAASFVFGGQSSTVSAGQSPNSLMGVSASFPSAAAFSFGGQSSSLSVGQGPTFATGASALSSSSGSSFAFGGQSGTIPVGQAPSFVAKPSGLFDQSGTGSTGQARAFGALPSSPANPFLSTSGSSSSPFMFGSSAAVFGSSAVSSTSSVYTSSSSGVPSFGGSSTFQFGAPAMSSPLMSASSMSSMTTNSLPFSSSPAPTLSATPTFSFGASAAGSAPSGQPFAFGAAQPNPFAANHFSSSGTQNPASDYNFGAPAMAATPSPFSSSGSPVSMFTSNAAPNTSNIFAFGSASTPNPSSPFAFGSGQPAPVQAPTPAPFAFGGQPAAVSGQPFGFGGGQPATNPFSATGTSQPGPEFAGGFALGATSGDKSGRKFIKAKRIGGTKRGK